MIPIEVEVAVEAEAEVVAGGRERMQDAEQTDLPQRKQWVLTLFHRNRSCHWPLVTAVTMKRQKPCLLDRPPKYFLLNLLAKQMSLPKDQRTKHKVVLEPQSRQSLRTADLSSPKARLIYPLARSQACCGM